MKHTRRRFLGSAAAVAAALGIDGFDSSLTAARPEELQSERLRRGLGRSARQQPQVIYTNARVYTMDDRVPRADAFAIEGNRFLAVGAADDVLNLADGHRLTVASSCCAPNEAKLEKPSKIRALVRVVAILKSLSPFPFFHS